MYAILRLDTVDHDLVTCDYDVVPELPNTIFDDAAWAGLIARLPVAVSYSEALNEAIANDEATAHCITTNMI